MRALWEGARVGIAEARRLVEAEDADGAADRACFAALDAARAVLGDADGALGQRALDQRALARRFEAEVVLTQRLDRDIGKLLTILVELRSATDLPVTPMTVGDAERAVAAAEIFVRHCEPLVAEGSSPPGTGAGAEGA